MKNRCRLLAFCLITLAAASAQAQSPYERYSFSTYAGKAGISSGSTDGAGSEARFHFPRAVGIDASDNIYVISHESTIRRITPAGLVTTVGSISPNSVGGYGVAVEPDGTVYLTNAGHHMIKKISPTGVLTHVAGSQSGTWGTADGDVRHATLWGPSAVARDSAGNLYVAETGSDTIRKITPAGLVSTLAGLAGSSGDRDGTGSAARFQNPSALTLDKAGNIYVCDQHAIRKVSPAGEVTTLAGAVLSSGSNDGAGTTARFNNPLGVTVDDEGTIYVADTKNNTIRKVTASGVVTTIAGVPGRRDSVDGAGAAAGFYWPVGIGWSASGNLYIADALNNTIRVLTPDGVVTTLAGMGSAGTADGAGENARFMRPRSVAIGNDRSVYVADTNNRTIRKISPDRVVTTLAGSVDNAGSTDGPGAAASFGSPTGVAVDHNGNVFVADMPNKTIRKIDPDGTVSTFAGRTGVRGQMDGVGAVAQFWDPISVTTDKAGNVYVADVYQGGGAIRKITPEGAVTTLAGGHGYADGIGSAARFNFSTSQRAGAGVAADGDGNVYVADTFNSAIRKVTPAGEVTTFASAARGARLKHPEGVAVDRAGNVYVADTGYHVIRKFTPAGIETTLAGAEDLAGSSNGIGGNARFASPTDVAVDTDGYVYVADSGTNAIRRGGPGAIGQPLNISTRATVGTGDNVMIGGFISQGPSAKKVMLRAIGPFLQRSGLNGVLSDPALELRDSAGNLVASNDDWKNTDQAAIEGTGIPPSHDRESAIVTEIAPNQAYTATVRGAAGAAGVALVEVYDLTPTSGSTLANISTRATISNGEGVMIGGFIIGAGGSDPAKVLVRAIGPSLGTAGVSNPLVDPMLQLHDGNGNTIASNDNWNDSQAADIQATGIPPSSDQESAIVQGLAPGHYTAVVRGKDNTSGVGLIEVYNLQ